MPSRSRGEKVKGDVETDLLKRIPIAALIPAHWHSLFYEVLANLAITELDKPSQGTAILAAWTFTKMMEAMDTRRRPDDDPIDLDSVGKLQRQWCSLLEAMRKQAGEEKESEDVGSELQKELMRSLNANSD